jgi:hypothetical protein
VSATFAVIKPLFVTELLFRNTRRSCQVFRGSNDIEDWRLAIEVLAFSCWTQAESKFGHLVGGHFDSIFHQSYVLRILGLAICEPLRNRYPSERNPLP